LFTMSLANSTLLQSPPARVIPLSLLVERAVPEAAIDGDARCFVHSVTADSRSVEAGACFVAVRGTNRDGHDYLAEAAARGAAALVVERGRSPGADIAVPVVQVPDTAWALAKLAAEHSGLAAIQREGRLRVVGVTGTNGKSTFCYLMRSILHQAGHRSALLGTIQYDLLRRTIPAPMTTPPSVELSQMLVEAAEAGAAFAVMEVSSHALSQRRTDGILFHVAVFTNLTRDHLDYHRDFDSYLAAKRRLFQALPPHATAVVNDQDANAESVLAACRAGVLRYGFGDQDVHAVARSMTAEGNEFDLVTPHGPIHVRSPLVGTHNVANAMAAAAAAIALRIGLEEIRRGIEAVDYIPGRLERIPHPAAPFSVLVDYAHTDDALRNVLQAVRNFAPDRPLTVVFGCGGDRDRSKRPLMARAAAALADKIVVTSDNPRTEDPEAIIEQVVAGFDADHRRRVAVLVDRREAIQRAIAEAQPGEVVLLAGKGHETYQEVQGQRLDFDDRVVAAQALQRRFGSRT